MLLIVGFKIVVVPALIAAVTLAGRRWGPAVAGWLSGFPIVTGPILVFIAYEQDAAFGSEAALGTLLGIPAILAFNLAYAWTATRAAWPLSLAGALAAYTGAAFALVSWSPPASTSLALALLLLAFGARLFPHSGRAPAASARTSGHREVVYRMLAAAALVAAVTHFAATIGPQLSGLFAMFPVISIVLASFSHHSSGAAFVTRLLKGVILGWYALAVFSLLAYLLLPLTHPALAFLGAVIGATAMQLVSRRFIQS